MIWWRDPERWRWYLAHHVHALSLAIGAIAGMLLPTPLGVAFVLGAASIAAWAFWKMNRS